MTFATSSSSKPVASISCDCAGASGTARPAHRLRAGRALAIVYSRRRLRGSWHSLVSRRSSTSSTARGSDEGRSKALLSDAHRVGVVRSRVLACSISLVASSSRGSGRAARSGSGSIRCSVSASPPSFRPPVVVADRSRVSQPRTDRLPGPDTSLAGRGESTLDRVENGIDAADGVDTSRAPGARSPSRGGLAAQ